MKSAGLTLFLLGGLILLLGAAFLYSSKEKPSTSDTHASTSLAPVPVEEEAKPKKQQDAIKASRPDSFETPSGMVWIPGGTFQMGTEKGLPDEQPVHTVELDGFWMDETEVTNSEFKRFVDATGYVTLAEQKPVLPPDCHMPNGEKIEILPEYDKPGSVCAKKITREEIDPAKRHYNWWEFRVGANWKHPDGPGSTIEDRMDHPVVHVAHQDIMAYCKWSGRRLPTEAQWEYAARGGRKGELMFPWGNERTPDGKWMHNTWQGDFPFENDKTDGFETTCPVKSFPPNGFGLYELSGNVWEWCADFYDPIYYKVSPRRNPLGPKESFEPVKEVIDQPKYVQRGGSYMCSEKFCVGFRVTARMRGAPDTGSFHCGFRCVLNAQDIDTYKKAPRQQLAAKQKKVAARE